MSGAARGRRGRTGRRCWQLAAACLLTTVPLLARPVAADAAQSMSAAAVTALWSGYGNAGGHWTGADGTVSVALPDGRVAWLFADTYLGAVNADLSRPASSPLVHNTMVVQDGAQLTETRYGGTAAQPQSLVGPTSGDEWYWPNDGTVGGGQLRVLFNRYTRTGSGPLDFQLAGTALASFSLPALSLVELRQLPLGSQIGWGSALLDDGAFTYVYGTEATQDLKFAHLARAPLGTLGGVWEFWTGQGWSARESDSARLVSGVGTGYSVERLGAQYVLVTQDTNVAFGSHFAALTAPSPTGPFGAPAYLFTAAEPAQRPGLFVYDSRVHPELSQQGRLLVSYNVNSMNPAANLADVGIYRPRFVDVSWPPPAPDPAALPGQPGGLSLAASGDLVRVSWSAPAGGAAGYYLYRRDVTAGQTWFARLGAQVSGTSTEAGFLDDGHTYEFRVTAVNAAGEGRPSATASTTIHVAPPPAPANLRLTMTGAGEAQLAWDPVGAPVRYQVYQRDASAGQAAFSEVQAVDQTAASLTAPGLVNGHDYEFRVTALNGAGEGPPSNTVRGTARYDLPAAPTALQATAQGDGSVALSWQAPAPDLWYWVYQRDITGGETSATRLEYPVTTGTTARPGGLLAGHQYEFQVSAINQGGESPRSNAVRATVRYDPPGAPTGLQAGAQGDGSVALSWQAPAPDLWYWVYQRDVTGGETTATRLDYPVTSGTTARPGGLLAGHQYEFQVSAINQGGESARSSAVRATARYDPPAAPTGLQAGAGDGQVVLSWTAPSPGVWYWVYQRDVTAGESVFTRSEYPVTAGPTATLGLLTNGHDYEFQVTAINQGGESPASAVARARPMPRLPGKPANLTATSLANGGVRLSWDAPGPNLYYWVYQRDVSAGQQGFTRLQYPATSTGTVVAALTHGHRYEFTVAGTNLAGDGPTADPVQATADYSPPPAPAGLRGVQAGDGAVSLTWDAGEPNLYYWVYQRDVTAGQQGFTRSVYPTTANSAALSPLTPGHTYEFRVTAENPGGEGPASSTVSVTVQASLPAPPSGLRATAGNGEVQLSWSPSSSGNVYYWVYYRDATADQGFGRLELPASTTSVTVRPLTNGHTYEFRVTATNAAGDSAPSNTVSARPMPPLPAAPTGLSAIADNGAVGLGWSQTPNAESYWVYYRDLTAGQSGWTRLPYPTTNWWITVQPLSNGHTYEFKVTAVNMSGESAASAVVQARPVPPAPQPPSNLTAVAGDGQVRLSWTASPTANVYYWIYFRPQGQSDWYYLQYPTTGTSLTVKPLLNGFSYEFRVTAANLGGQSAPSNTVQARPAVPTPQPPSNLTAAAGDKQARLSWTASPTANVYYWVYFRPQGQSDWYYLQYPTTGTSLTVKPLLNGFSYEFRVTAANAAGQSAPSNTVSVRPLPPRPAAPALVVRNEIDRLVLDWNDNPDPQTLYDVCYSKTFDGLSPVWTCLRWPLLQWWNGTSYTFTRVNLEPRQTYNFRVTAYNVAGGTDSNVVTETFMDRRSVYLWFTGPTESDYYWWSLAKMDHSGWSAYGFNWNDNGCSGPIGDYPGGFPFGMSCKRHDFGYRNHALVGLNGEADRARIDLSLYADLLRVCVTQPSSKQHDCRDWADAYYTAVRMFGPSAWS